MSLTHENDPGQVETADEGMPPRRSRRLPWLICSFVCVLAVAVSTTVVLLATGSSDGSAPQAGGSQTAVASSAAASPATSSSAATYRAGDARACGALEQYGRAFYTGTYEPLMKQGSGHVSMNADPITLAAQLGVLYVKLDTATLSGASPAVRTALSQSASDADAFAQSFANIGVYGGKSPDMTSVVNSFTNALVACTMAGYQPSYFDPQQLVSH